MLIKVISLLFLVQCAFSEDSLIKPCPVEDIQCLSETTEKFLDRVASGIPDLDIKAIDPIIIDMVCSKGMADLMVHFKNANVTGLRKQKISDFKMDTAAKSVVLSVNVDVNIASNVELEFEKTKKIYSGTYSATGKAALTAVYNYEVKANDKGVEHFEVGPETITCDIKDLDAVASEEITNGIVNDRHAKKIYDENRADVENIKKRNACDILKTAFAVVIHNLRTIAKLYPKTAFFTNV
ncbi:juvenile hormone-binding protein-like [Hyposmocoma kahamanoa]|uniref:juvenile hormone-binding protein-like n=1 Tax=Hyposmocoma kahamanoa TaxID=1477025 RepID=UPI000E6D7E26|nr:juvenile hormone-binding protein-like [Hyposmocoma kahamanoa]